MKKLIFILLLTLIVTAGCGAAKEETAASKEMTVNDVVNTFKNANLECENTTEMNKDDYGLAPMKAAEAVRFLIPSLGPDSGGRIFIFENDKDLADTKAYYDTLGKESAAFFSWTFEKDNVLVQINGDLEEEVAKKYETALQGLK